MASCHAGLIRPQILPDGQVCVDMGEPILEGPRIPTTLAPTQNGAVVQQALEVAGRTYQMTCVSMGNPHAVTYSVDGQPIKVGGRTLVCRQVLASVSDVGWGHFIL